MSMGILNDSLFLMPSKDIPKWCWMRHSNFEGKSYVSLRVSLIIDSSIYLGNPRYDSINISICIWPWLNMFEEEAKKYLSRVIYSRKLMLTILHLNRGNYVNDIRRTNKLFNERMYRTAKSKVELSQGFCVDLDFGSYGFSIFLDSFKLAMIEEPISHRKWKQVESDHSIQRIFEYTG